MSTILTTLRRSPGMVAVLTLLVAARAQAAEKIWDGAGASGGATNWGTGANWDPDGVPVDGDALIFGHPFDTINFNDLNAAWFSWIWFSNSTWRLDGNGIRLSEGLTNSVSGTQTIGLSITTTAAQVWHNGISGSTVLLGGNAVVRLDAGIRLTGRGNFTIHGPITGSGAITSSLRISAATMVPTLQLTNGGNTFSGGLVINDSNRVHVTASGTAGSGNIIATNGGQLWLATATNLAPLYLADRGFVENAGALGALRIDGGQSSVVQSM